MWIMSKNSGDTTSRRMCGKKTLVNVDAKLYNVQLVVSDDKLFVLGWIQVLHPAIPCDEVEPWVLEFREIKISLNPMALEKWFEMSG